MQEINLLLGYNIQPGSLDAAIRAALTTKFIGLSTYGPTRPISLWLDDTATPANETTATNLANAHDPVFLTVDKVQIAADGSDTATVTVTAPKPGAAAVTLVATKADGTTVTEAVPLVAGVGTMAFKTAIPGAFVITVQNPTNRSADALTITGV